MVAVMDDFDDVGLPERGPDMAVGAGAAILIAVATAVVLAMTVMVTSLSSAHAAVMPAVSAGGAIERSLVAGDARLARTEATFRITDVAARDGTYVVADKPRDGDSSLAGIAVTAILLGIAAATADLWRHLYDQVKSRGRLRH